MSYADEVFKKVAREIIDNGDSTVGTEVRPRWEDGTPAHTLHINNVVNTYDVSKEFPLMTLRKTGIKSAVDEILWIYQKKSNRVSELNSHIWDQWTDDSGTIGKAYGYQIGQTYLHHSDNLLIDDRIYDEEKYQQKMKSMFPSFSTFLTVRNGKYLKDRYMDQMDSVLYDLTYNPSSRRIMTNTYKFNDLYKMGLYPCAYSTTWNIYKNRLNLILNQRSQDMLAASNWNVVQYAALLIMVAKATGHEVGMLTHVISDCHIYDRHIPIVEELISRESYDAPKVTFENDSTNFYSYIPEDFIVEDYKYGEQVKFEVAI